MLHCGISVEIAIIMSKRNYFSHRGYCEEGSHDEPRFFKHLIDLSIHFKFLNRNIIIKSVASFKFCF